MKKLGNLVGIMLVVLGAAWLPAAIVFIIMGVWGDDRWFATGFILLATFCIAAMGFLVFYRDHRARSVDRGDHDR